MDILVAIDMFEQVHQWDVEHIALATWADAYVVVPATTNVIGKFMLVLQMIC